MRYYFKLVPARAIPRSQRPEQRGGARSGISLKVPTPWRPQTFADVLAPQFQFPRSRTTRYQVLQLSVLFPSSSVFEIHDNQRTILDYHPCLLLSMRTRLSLFTSHLVVSARAPCSHDLISLLLFRNFHYIYIPLPI